MTGPEISPNAFLSFFSGALGLDLGLEASGLVPLAVNDCDAVACNTIRANRPDLNVYEDDVRNLDAHTLMEDLAFRPGDLFLVAGGPPCQAFSTAGKRLGLNDDRGNVFLHFIDLIGELRPKYVLIENVRGLLSVPLVHRPHSERGVGHPPLSIDERPGGALHHIVTRLADQGYEVTFNLYSAANFGVPQIRERLVIFGSRDGRPIPHLVPTHDEHGRHGLSHWATFKDAVADLGEHDHSNFPERRLRYYRLLKPGQNWRNLPESLRPEAMGKSFFAGGGKTGFYRRLAWDKPSPTLVTCPTMPATDLAHPTEDRPLSVQEYARLQMFPDDWQFTGSMTDKYRQIGNAVPVGFGAVIGRHLLDFDSGTLEPSLTGLPLSRYRNTDHESWFASVRRQGADTEQLALL